MYDPSNATYVDSELRGGNGGIGIRGMDFVGIAENGCWEGECPLLKLKASMANVGTTGM